MADAIIPINQQNSFPLVSVSGAQQATDVRIVGGMVVKYWGPAATGISGTLATDDGNGHICCVSNYLDMTGCSNAAAEVRRVSTVNPGPLAVTPFLLQMQYRLLKATVMPTSNLLGGAPPVPPSVTELHLLQCGMVPLQTGAGFAFAASPGTNGCTEYALIPWGPSAAGTSGANPPPVAIGSDVRFIISFGSIAVAATDSFSLSI